MPKLPVLLAAAAATVKLEELRAAAISVELTGAARRKLLAAISSMQSKIDEIGRIEGGEAVAAEGGHGGQDTPVRQGLSTRATGGGVWGFKGLGRGV